jgi:hypothetical protein
MEGSLMTTPKRKIKAKPFVRDLRDGMSDGKLMEKYLLSPDQLQKVFQRLVDAGEIDEMELFMRTSLDDSTIIKAFADIQRPVGELDNLEEVTSHHDLGTPSEITVTERIKTLSKVVGGIVSKLAGTGS